MRVPVCDAAATQYRPHTPGPGGTQSLLLDVSAPGRETLRVADEFEELIDRLLASIGEAVYEDPP